MKKIFAKSTFPIIVSFLILFIVSAMNVSAQNNTIRKQGKNNSFSFNEEKAIGIAPSTSKQMPPSELPQQKQHTLILPSPQSTVIQQSDIPIDKVVPSTQPIKKEDE